MKEETYYPSVAVVIIVMSSLSIVGGAVVILSYLLLKQLRNFALKMVAYLCLSDFLSNMSMLIIPPTLIHENQGKYNHKAICTVQSILQSWGDLSSIMWCGMISVVIYLTVVRRVHQEKLKKNEYIFIIIGFLIPLFVSSVPFLSDSYGEDTYYCWIQSNKKYDLAMKILINYAPLWTTFLVITILNCFTAHTIKNMENVTVVQQKSMKKMLLYPYILIIASFWASIVALMEFSNMEIPEFIQILHHLFARSLGLLNAFMYGLTPVVRQKLRLYLQSAQGNLAQTNNTSKRSIRREQNQQEGDQNTSYQEEEDMNFEDDLSESSDGGGIYKKDIAINSDSYLDSDFLKYENKKEKLHEILI